MDNPPPYDNNGRLPNWSSDEKDDSKGKACEVSNDCDDDHQSDSGRRQLQIEGGHGNSSSDQQLALVNDRGATAAGSPRITISGNVPTQRISASYFRPQPTLDQPLDIDVRLHNTAGNDALVVRNADNRVASVRQSPGLSHDEQLALVLSEHPDMDFDDALKMIENAGEEVEIEDVSDMHVAPYTSRSSVGSQVTVPPKRGITVRPQSDVAAAIRLPNEELTYSRLNSQPASRARSSISYGGRASSITPSESASQVPRTAAEQEDEDFRLALELSRQDSGPPQRSFGEPSGSRVSQASDHFRAAPAPSSTVSMPSFLQNSARSRTMSPNQALATPAPVQPLFAPGTGSSLLGGSYNALLPRTNTGVEQQRLADLAAIQNLQAERSAQRSIVESDLYSQLGSPPEDRALKAQLALAREDLRDSRLATQMTALSLNQNRLASMRRFADEDEISAAQRRVDAESRRRFQLAQAESRKQESMEKTRMRDRRWQAEQEELREQEERDRAFALELQQTQHDHIVEKVDAFGRATQQPRRSCAIHPTRHNLEMSTFSDVDGDRREINYEAAPSDAWTPEHDQAALQGWDEYEKAGGKPRGGSIVSSASRGRGKGRGKKK